jgi:hypothetical protein
MSKIEPWTQEELQTQDDQPEAPLPWYEVVVRIGVAFLLAVLLVALLWPAIAQR